MSHKTGLIAIFLIVGAMVGLSSAGVYNLPPLPPPERYGSLIINRNSVRNGIRPVTFSHWLHRQKFTCRVCHTELEFNLEANTTPITELDNRNGKFCGACHNGGNAFRHYGNCERCHNGSLAFSDSRFGELLALPLPTTMFGNGIDWTEAIRRGTITPREFLKKKPQSIAFDKTLILESEWSTISASIFPHDAHTRWLDCDSCHPDIFNIKKKTTKHFSMEAIVQGKFCGACHLTVAFPVDDCKRCHPAFEM